jgi:hypothetical protein
MTSSRQRRREQLVLERHRGPYRWFRFAGGVYTPMEARPVRKGLVFTVLDRYLTDRPGDIFHLWSATEEQWLLTIPSSRRTRR